MDTYGDLIGVVVVAAMIRVGWSLARAALNEAARPRPEPVLDLTADSPR